MGRPRKKDRHLPERMQHRHGAYYYTVGGRWLPLGRDYGAALAKWAELQGASVRPGKTVADALAYYLQARRPELSPRTVEAYQASQKRLGDVFGDLRLMEVRPEHVTRYLRQHAHKVTANRDKALLCAAYNWVNAEGWLELAGYNPARVKRNTEKPRSRYVTDVELGALLDKANPKMRSMIELAYLTGVRKGDLLRITLQDVQDDGLHVQQGKTGKRQVFAWTDELRRVVDAARGLRRRVGSMWLFPAERDPSRPLTPRGLHSEWDKIRKAAKVAGVTWHDLRRKAGSDADEGHATAMLGHADARTTKRHYRAAPAVVRPLR